MNQFDARPRVMNRLPENPEKGSRGRFPSWLHRPLPKGGTHSQTEKIVGGLNTVCEEAKCPNRFECYSKKTATFLAMGHECTRACGFCDIAHSKAPAKLDENEPARIALSVKQLGLKHAVITMVARDDLEDGGAHHLVKIIEAIRSECPGVTVEILTSDFHGNFEAIDHVLESKPEIFNYNTETVRALTPRVRHKATYDRTLSILKHVKGKTRFVKSGLMVGLGETPAQVEETIRDLHEVGIDIITIGQYLQPSRKKLIVKEFITPEQFKAYETYGLSIGVPNMYCGPFVRSSYNADLFVEKGA
ncbi:MAG: lipoyl synthase [Simkaniaceae bacterium]|nr:lipoyl synthase [Simkaniaceae bacterium]